MPLNIQTEKQVRMLHRNHRPSEGGARRERVQGHRSRCPCPWGPHTCGVRCVHRYQQCSSLSPSGLCVEPNRRRNLPPKRVQRSKFGGSSERSEHVRNLPWFHRGSDQWARIKRVASGHQAVMLLEFLDQLAFVLKNPAAEGAPARSEQER